MFSIDVAGCEPSCSEVTDTADTLCSYPLALVTVAALTPFLITPYLMVPELLTFCYKYQQGAQTPAYKEITLIADVFFDCSNSLVLKYRIKALSIHSYNVKEFA